MDALTVWAEVYNGMWDMADGFHGSLNWAEMQAQANLLVVAGRADLAAIMIREWAILEKEEGELDDEARARLGEFVADLPTIPDHRLEGEFDWAEYTSPSCDECDEVATNFWPELKEPVKLCDSCEHNARRSGWEPGQ